MSAKPIPFSAGMAGANWRGTKTQTRRTVNPQPILSDMVGFSQMDRKGIRVAYGRGSDAAGTARNFIKSASPYQIGNLLWVREPWRVGKGYDDLPGSRFTVPSRSDIHYEADSHSISSIQFGRYRHGRFMPRWASRMTLKVTEVRVQPLWDITEKDAIAEGITEERIIDGVSCYGGHPVEHHSNRYFFYGCRDEGFESAVDAYAALWDKINGCNAWLVNDWVWVINYEVIRQNINEVLKVAT